MGVACAGLVGRHRPDPGLYGVVRGSNDHQPADRPDQGGPQPQRHPDLAIAGSRLRHILRDHGDTPGLGSRPCAAAIPDRGRHRLLVHGHSDVRAGAQLLGTVSRAHGGGRGRGRTVTRGALTDQRPVSSRETRPSDRRLFGGFGCGCWLGPRYWRGGDCAGRQCGNYHPAVVRRAAGLAGGVRGRRPSRPRSGGPHVHDP